MMVESADHPVRPHDVGLRTTARPAVDRQELILFTAATVAAWTHTLDEVRIGELVAVPFGIANLAVIAGWTRLGEAARAAAAIAFGLFWALAAIPYHVVPLFAGTATWQDVSGLSRVVGGAAMVAVGVQIALRRRR